MFVQFQKMRILEPSVAMKELGLQEHQIRFTSTITVEHSGPPNNTTEKIYNLIKRYKLILVAPKYVQMEKNSPQYCLTIKHLISFKFTYSTKYANICFYFFNATLLLRSLSKK